MTEEVNAIYQHNEDGELKVYSYSSIFTKQETEDYALVVEQVSGKETYVAKTTEEIVKEESK